MQWLLAASATGTSRAWPDGRDECLRYHGRKRAEATDFGYVEVRTLAVLLHMLAPHLRIACLTMTCWVHASCTRRESEATLKLATSFKASPF